MLLTYTFSPMDELMFPLFYAYIFGFPCADTEKRRVQRVLTDGWVNTITEYPFLAGEIEYDMSKGKRPGSLKLRVPGILNGDSQVIVKDLSTPNEVWRSSYDELRAQNMPLRKMDGKILAPLTYDSGSITKVAMIQINFIPGGCLLSICLSHTLADANSSNIILRLWASHCRELQGLSADSCDRKIQALSASKVLPAWETVTGPSLDDLKHRPELWHLQNMDMPEHLEPGLSSVSDRFCHIPSARALSADSATDTCMLTITPTALKQLKRKASPEAPAWISSHDALVALLWRCIMRARYPPSTLSSGQERKKANLGVPIDARSLLSVPAGASYLGNVLLRCTISLFLDELLSPAKGLADVAVAIRSTIRQYNTTAIMQDVACLAARIPNVRDVRPTVPDIFCLTLWTTSWTAFPFYDIEFGPIFGDSGRAEFLRMPRGQFATACIIHPPQRNGNMEVSILLRVEELSRLKRDEELAEFVVINP